MKSHEQARGKSWVSHGRIMNKSLTSHEKVMCKSCTIHEQVMGKSWKSHEQVINNVNKSRISYWKIVSPEKVKKRLKKSEEVVKIQELVLNKSRTRHKKV